MIYNYPLNIGGGHERPEDIGHSFGVSGCVLGWSCSLSLFSLPRNYWEKGQIMKNKPLNRKTMLMVALTCLQAPVTNHPTWVAACRCVVGWRFGQDARGSRGNFLNSVWFDKHLWFGFKRAVIVCGKVCWAFTEIMTWHVFIGRHKTNVLRQLRTQFKLKSQYTNKLGEAIRKHTA